MFHDSDDDDDLAADPLAAFKAGPRPSDNHHPSGSSTPPTAPAPVFAPAPTAFAPTGSGFTSINRPSIAPTSLASASQSRAEDDPDPFAFDANNIPVGDGEDEADVVEETRRPASSNPSAHRVKRSGQTRPRSATRERTRSRQATEEREHGHGHGQGKVQGAHVQDQLVPRLPRAASESNDGDIIDMTAGDDVVRRVLAEADRSGEIFKVELGDYSVEEVRFVLGCNIFTSAHLLSACNHYYLRTRHKPLQLRLVEIHWPNGIRPFSHILRVLSLFSYSAHFVVHMSNVVLFQATTTLVCTHKYLFIHHHFPHFDKPSTTTPLH